MDRKHVRVAVVFGGRSSEHEVSLASAANVMDALDKAGYTVVPVGITPVGRWLTAGAPMRRLCDAAALPPAAQAAIDAVDSVNGRVSADRDAWALLPSTTHTPQLATVDIIFPVLHGPYGEDGTIQGMLEMANLPYVGCGVAGSAVAMDKIIAKHIFTSVGLPQVRDVVVTRPAWQANPDRAVAAVEAALSYPVFVKPANLGSSVGVHKVHDRAELLPAIADAAQYDRKVLVEEAVPNAREIEVSVLGNDAPIASVPGEILPGHEFYDYAAKYLDDASQLLIPANLTEDQTAAVRRMAVQAFQAIDGSGLARVDFLVDGEAGDIYLNEINTMPGFTRISMYPKLWEASGIPYPELVDRLVQLGLERFADRQQNRTSRAV